MTDKDIIFKFYEPEELVDDEFSYFGWEGERGYAFLHFATAYKEAAELIYDEMKDVNSGNRDALIYPLCFNYRHCMEMLLKYLFVEHSKVDEEDLKNFLELNHNLHNIWKEVKPILSKGKRRVGTIVSIGAIEHYVKEIHKFDEMSMRMRYPISKKLKPNNGSDFRLDFHNFHDSMIKFYFAVIQISHDISNQVYYQASPKEYDLFLDKYKHHKQSLIDFVSILKEISKKQEDKSSSFIDNLLNGKYYEEDRYLNYLDNLVCDCKVLIETLYYAGRSVKTQEVRLSLSPNDKVKDFINFCIFYMPTLEVKFGEEPTHLNVVLKSKKSIIENIETSMNILDNKKIS